MAVVFRAAKPTKVAATNEMRKHLVHDSQVAGGRQKGGGSAFLRARCTTTFASHFLMAGYDLPTIQMLLGHGDIGTTMIYVQTVLARMVREAWSPFDL